LNNSKSEDLRPVQYFVCTLEGDLIWRFIGCKLDGVSTGMATMMSKPGDDEIEFATVIEFRYCLYVVSQPKKTRGNFFWRKLGKLLRTKKLNQNPQKITHQVSWPDDIAS
jgi:hypothetical protein